MQEGGIGYRAGNYAKRRAKGRAPRARTCLTP